MVARGVAPHPNLVDTLVVGLGGTSSDQGVLTWTSNCPASLVMLTMS